MPSQFFQTLGRNCCVRTNQEQKRHHGHQTEAGPSQHSHTVTQVLNHLILLQFSGFRLKAVLHALTQQKAADPEGDRRRSVHYRN